MCRMFARLLAKGQLISYHKLNVFHVLALICITGYLVPLSLGDQMLYVHPENDTVLCPTVEVHCMELSQYAQNPYRFLDYNTTFVFLPGNHILDRPFYVIGDRIYSHLSLVAEDPHSDTTFTNRKNATLTFERFASVEINGLNFSFRVIGTCSIRLFLVSDFQVRSCNIRDNVFMSICLRNTTMTLVETTFANNKHFHLSIDYSNVTMINNTILSNTESGILVYFSSLTLDGTNIIAANTATENPATMFAAYFSTMTLRGSTTFMSNMGNVGALFAVRTQVTLLGETVFLNNTMTYSGVFTAIYGQVDVMGKLAFKDNCAEYGGGLYLEGTTFIVSSESFIEFLNNSATNGGAMYMTGDSQMNFDHNGGRFGTMNFSKNCARHRGGAIYVQSTNILSYCPGNRLIDAYTTTLDCFFKLVNIKMSDPISSAVFFRNNSAMEAGDAVYGDALEYCTAYDGELDQGPFFDGVTVFREIAETENSSSEVSSDPYIVCICRDDNPDCSQDDVHHRVYPGSSVNVPVVAMGQMKGISPATISAVPVGLGIARLQESQTTQRQCTNVTYTIFGLAGNGSLVLFAEGPCLTSGTSLVVTVEVLECPPGFQFVEQTQACECNERLNRYTNSCNTLDGSIVRSSPFWAGYDSSSNGLILYPNCPLDFCVSNEISFRVDDSDTQCSLGRVGLLCGGCAEGYSLLLGTLRCGKCSNKHLGLVVAFAAAGVALVAFLLVLNITVASGTINGLIFYANIVSAEQTIFFPQISNGYLNFLKAFIAWINLDISIETCFYDGMNTYEYTWLQFSFPAYIWALIGLVFLISHFSIRASRLFGNNPVAVLATLIILSYTKILRAIIVALSTANLEYPHGRTEVVWFYDGNVLFLDAKHTVLFIFSLVVLLFLIVPYSLMLLTGQWLLKKSHWRILSWMNRPQLQAFLDAYHAPYKPKHRYWNGLLFLVRLAILIPSAANISSDPGINVVIVYLFVLAILLYQWIVGGIYKEFGLNLLDTFFLLNLLCLVVSTFYIQSKFCTPSQLQTLTEEGQRPQSYAVIILVTSSLMVALAITIYHGYLRLRKTRVWGSLNCRLPKVAAKHTAVNHELFDTLLVRETLRYKL